MPEIILWWIMTMIEKGAKGFWSLAVVFLLIMPLGIPLLIMIGLIRAIKGKYDARP